MSQYCTFTLDGHLFGVPVSSVQEVLRAQALTSVPLAPSEVAGLLNLRGQIVTAVDLRARLGLPPRPAGEGFMNVVVRDAGELFSLLADSVGDVVEVETVRLEPTPATLDERWKGCCDGVVRLPRGLLAVLDVERLLRLESPTPGR